MHKKIKQWSTGKALTRVEQIQFMANAKREQDLKNNSLLDNDYFKPANNNWKLYELGCVPVNMNTQPYQPRVVRRSK
tara:strand:+ start:392 stop:622 length:231 start_codon:yes stop_codon:yes gene_type:complete